METNHLLPTLLLMATTTVFAAPAAAQDAHDQPPAFRQTTIDVAFGGIASYGGGGVDLRLSAAIPVSDRRSIELFAGVAESGDYLNTRGVYGMQFRRLRSGKDADYQAYSSFGFMGLVARYETADCSYGHCIRTTSNHVFPPVLFLAGGGVDFDVKPRLRMHLESQVAFALFVPVSVRVAVGVSVPLGRASSNQRVYR